MSKSANKSSVIFKKAICISVSFIQSLLITVLAASLCLIFISTPQFAKHAIKSSNYVDLAIKEMTEDLNDLAIPSGLPSNFFDDKFDENDYAEFEKLSNLRISSDIKQSGYTVDTTAIKNKLKGHIEDYAAENLGSSEAISSAAIDQLLNECATIYKSYLRPAAFRRFFTGLGQISRLLIIVALVVFAVAIAAFVFLFKLCSKKEFKRYEFSSFSGSGLMLGFLPFFLLITGKISEIGIASESMRSFFVVFLSDALTVLLIASVVIILISVICLSIKHKPSFFKKSLKTLDKTE